jgi:hypothetical protein
MQDERREVRMYRAWTASAERPEDLSRAVEVHLNEFAGEIISVAYAVHQGHHALVVYRPIEIDAGHAAAEVMAGALFEEPGD